MAADVIRTLHVEDDVVQHRLVSFWLKKSSQPTFEIHWAKGEQEALAKFADQPIHLILLDYQLAEGDGLHLLKQIRSRDARVPILALSASVSDDIAAELLRAGANEFFCKTEMNGPRLLEAIRSVCAAGRDETSA